MIRVSCIVAALLWLSACSILEQHVLDKGSVPYQLQPVPVEFNQQVWSHSLSFSGQGVWLTQIEFQQQNMVLVALSPAGLPLLQLTWSAENGLNVIQAPPFPVEFNQVLRDIQLIHWPLASVKAGLPKSINVRQDALGNAKIKRSLISDGQLLVNINYAEQHIQLQNHLQQYQLLITEL